MLNLIILDLFNYVYTKNQLEVRQATRIEYGYGEILKLVQGGNIVIILGFSFNYICIIFMFRVFFWENNICFHRKLRLNPMVRF